MGDTQDKPGIVPSKPLTPEQAADLLLHAVWPIVARVNGEWHPHGSGFLISYTGLFVTARHVVESPSQKRGRALGADGKWFDEGKFYALIPERTGENGEIRPPAVLHMVRMDFSKRSDIAVCQLDLSEGAAPPDITALVLHPGLPRIRERVVIFGYTQLDLSVIKESEEELALHANTKSLLSSGHVEAIDPLRKATGIGDFPSFTVSAEVPGGMSGGPVINEEGRVIGVVSHSPDWEPTATAALIGFALATTVHLLPQPGSDSRSALLRDLIRDRIVGADESAGDVELVPLGGDDYQVTMHGPTERR